MKTFFLLISILSSINALNINEALLKIHATLVPKICLMDYNFAKKSINNTINITIVYEMDNYKSANFLQELILRKYKNGIQSYKIKITLVEYDKAQTAKANLFYLFPSSKSKTIDLVKKAKSEHALTFSYSKNDLKYGIMISLDVSSRIKPLLNLQAIKKNNISLRPILIDISSIYHQDLKKVLLNNLNIIDKTNYIALVDIDAY